MVESVVKLCHAIALKSHKAYLLNFTALASFLASFCDCLVKTRRYSPIKLLGTL
jgi:hypothetical protein